MKPKKDTKCTFIGAFQQSMILIKEKKYNFKTLIILHLVFDFFQQLCN